MDPLKRCERVVNKGLENEYRCESEKITGGFCDKCSQLNEVSIILEFGCRYIVSEVSETKFRCGKQIDEFGLCTDCLNNRNYIFETYSKYVSLQGKKCMAVALTGLDCVSYCTKTGNSHPKTCTYCSTHKSYETLIKYDFFKNCVPSDRLHSSEYNKFMRLHSDTMDVFYMKPQKLAFGKMIYL